jgi:predicted DNA-binding protein
VVEATTRRTTINIPVEVKERLEKVRRELGAEDWAQFFKMMIEIYNEWKSIKLEQEVREVLCNNYSEAKGALPAWGKLLASKLRDPDKIAVALKYLKLVEGGEYVVDKEMCKGRTG